MKKVIVITGGTSGIGLQAARVLSQKGCRVYELSRRESGTDAAMHIQADVTDEDQVRRAIEQIMDREKHIDVVINNAGFGISGAIEYTDTEEAKRQFDVNFFGGAYLHNGPLQRGQALRDRGLCHHAGRYCDRVHSRPEKEPGRGRGVRRAHLPQRRGHGAR